jgi:DME family drug/metabolite transporter
MLEKIQINRGFIYVLLAATLWGTTGTSQALAPVGAQPAAVGSLRLAIGGLALLGFSLLRGTFRSSARWPIKVTLVAAVSMAAYQLCFFAGVAKTGVAVGTVVGIGSSPILAGLISFLVLGERPGRVWAAATLLAVLGCALLVGSGGSIQIDILGILLAIGAGLAYAIFTVVSKQLLATHHPEAVMAVVMTIGAAFLLPFLLAEDLSWLSQPRGILVAMHLGLVTVAVAYTLFGRGLQLVPVATAATLTLAEPLTASSLGVFLLGEKLSPPAVAGIVLIFAGLALLSLQGNVRLKGLFLRRGNLQG